MAIQVNDTKYYIMQFVKDFKSVLEVDTSGNIFVYGKKIYKNKKMAEDLKEIWEHYGYK